MNRFQTKKTAGKTTSCRPAIRESHSKATLIGMFSICPATIQRDNSVVKQKLLGIQ